MDHSDPYKEAPPFTLSPSTRMPSALEILNYVSPSRYAVLSPTTRSSHVPLALQGMPFLSLPAWITPLYPLNTRLSLPLSPGILHKPLPEKVECPFAGYSLLRSPPSHAIITAACLGTPCRQGPWLCVFFSLASQGLHIVQCTE